MLLVRVVVVLVVLGVVLAQGEEQVSVTRGGDGDYVSLNSSQGSCRISSCAQNFSSYLVEDRACVNDTTLQKSETESVCSYN